MTEKDYVEAEDAHLDVLTMFERSPLQQQFDVMKEHLRGNGSIHKALIEMTNLIEMFYNHLESKNHEGKQ